MNKTRKYGSVVLLIIMSLALVCFNVDLYYQASNAVAQTVENPDVIVTDNIDLDDIEEAKLTDKKCTVISNYEKISQSIVHSSECSIALVSDDLKLGLVRRYLPQEDDSAGANYAQFFLKILKNNGIDVAFRHCHFFCPKMMSMCVTYRQK